VRYAASIALLALGCSEPTLNVDVQVPPQYADALVTADVIVLQPTTADAFGCDRLALNEVTAEAVELTTVFEALDTPDLSEISVPALSRTGTKLFWVTGKTDDGQRLFTGCAAFGELESDQTLEIETVGVPYLETPNAERIRGQVPAGTETSTATIVIVVRDALDDPLPGVLVRATTRSREVTKPIEETTNEQGTAVVTPTIPKAAGPYEVEFQVRWGDVDDASVPGLAVDYNDGKPRVGQYGPRAGLWPIVRGLAVSVAGQVGLLLESPQRGRLHVVANPTALHNELELMEWTRRVADVDEPSETQLLAHPTQNRFVLISGDSWRELAPDGRVEIERSPYDKPGGATVVQRAITVDTCDETMYAVSFANGTGGLYRLDGTLVLEVDEKPGFELVTSGCLQETQTPAHILAAKSGAPSLRVGAGEVFAEGVGFSSGLHVTPGRFDEPHTIVASQLILNDWVITELSVRRVPARLVITSDLVVNTGPGRPADIASGDFDGDGQRDVAAILHPARSGVSAAIAIGLSTGVYGRAAFGKGCTRYALAVADLDGNGRDDIIAANSDRCDSGTHIRVLLH